MGLIVDSNVFIESERRQGAVDLSPWKDRGPVFLSAVTMSELLVGAHDLWIAATAVALGHAVLTNNVAEFSRVPGLEVLPFVMD